jgi:hypothetical protein
MNESLYESLSRLMSDDLPANEAAALRRRIEDEPETARAWAHLHAVVDGLEALPTHVEPPSVVIQAPARHPLHYVSALLAAALALLLLWPQAPQSVVLGPGRSDLEGRLTVFAGDLVIDLDGHAAIFVEPGAGMLRDAQRIPTPQESEMSKSMVIAGMAGAAVTVMLYEGSAAVTGVDATATELVIGDARTFEGAAPAQRPEIDPSQTDAAKAEWMRQRVAELTAEIGAIQDDLATERFAGQLVEAELQRVQGIPSEWTADVPDALRPARIEKELVEKVASMPGYQVAEVDCSEYPCVAAFEYTGDDQTLEWGSEVGEFVKQWADGNLDAASVSMNKSVFKDDDQTDRFLLVAVGEEGMSEDVENRTDSRMDSLIDDLGERLKERRAPAAP